MQKRPKVYTSPDLLIYLLSIINVIGLCLSSILFIKKNKKIDPKKFCVELFVVFITALIPVYLSLAINKLSISTFLEYETVKNITNTVLILYIIIFLLFLSFTHYNKESYKKHFIKLKVL